jgi:hypothetical protein
VCLEDALTGVSVETETETETDGDGDGDLGTRRLALGLQDSGLVDQRPDGRCQRSSGIAAIDDSAELDQESADFRVRLGAVLDIAARDPLGQRDPETGDTPRAVGGHANTTRRPGRAPRRQGCRVRCTGRALRVCGQVQGAGVPHHHRGRALVTSSETTGITVSAASAAIAGHPIRSRKPRALARASAMEDASRGLGR